MVKYDNWDTIIQRVGLTLLNLGYAIETDKWQGIEFKGKIKFWEYLVMSMQGNINKPIEILQQEIKPSLPWADLHFEERIGGLPLNPGESYKQWPYYGQDEKMRVDHQFSHTYMERFWPKMAGTEYSSAQKWIDKVEGREQRANWGIRYEYGDLGDLLNHLNKDGHSRQAYLPVFFPEDTGAVHGGRVPCSLGYHFIIRHNYLHCIYYLRSCDYFRHFRDDLYLAAKLTHFIANELNQVNLRKLFIKPGLLTTHITSLHIFGNEIERLKKSITI